MDDLLSEFLTETAESIDVVDNELVKFEKNPNDKAVLDNIFRLVHTIKGTCGFLGLPRLEAVAHASETVLGKFRDGVLTVTPAAVSLILESLDQIKEILAYLEAQEREPEGDDEELIARLLRAAEGEFDAVDEEELLDDDDEPALHVDEKLGRPLKVGEVSLDDLEAAFNAAPGPDDIDIGAEAAVEVTASVQEEPETVQEAAPQPSPPSAPVVEQVEAEVMPAESKIQNQSIRVNLNVLEDLMTMVSELVLTRNQLLQMVRGLEDSEFKVPLQRLSNVTAELQDSVMKTRMQPIGKAWQKIPRIIRDIAQDRHKKIQLEMQGEDTELDRQVLELIKDPLTHMVRNSCDHGIETPEERTAAGKPESGTVFLKAYHEGGHIIIEVQDDGRGLDVERIKEKAIAKGLATEEQIAQMSEAQIQKFIFHPGFSTAAQVTNVSGRGVGMDVVRTNIELIGGSIDLRSVFGKGSGFTIKIPLTLAIVSSLIVEAGGWKFAIPQLNVVELVRTGAGSEVVIETINNTLVLRLRDRLLPLVTLSDVLNIEDENLSHDDDGRADGSNETGESELNKALDATKDISVLEHERAPEDTKFVVIAQVGEQKFGIIVDNIFDTEEIVVKPVASILRDLPVYSGNTILGDGSVIMIIDPTGLARCVTDHMDEHGEMREQLEEEKIVGEAQETTSLLLFRSDSDVPKAVPLSLVTRLEEIPIDQIEYSNNQYVVQYRGGLMPLIHASSGGVLKEAGRQPVLVFTDNERSMGLAVDDIVDIIEDRLDIEMNSDTPGILGSAIIKERATEVVDVAYFLDMAYDDWFHRREKLRQTNKSRRVLLVDDNAFFRNMVTPLLNIAGYDVTSVGSVEEAMALNENGDCFDVIVSDIEMPGADGFEFARQVKASDSWKDTPLLALSGFSDPDDLEQGYQAGFLRYISKSDREGLIQTLDETCSISGEAA